MDFPIILLCLLLLLSSQGAAFFFIGQISPKNDIKIPKLESASRKRVSRCPKTSKTYPIRKLDVVG